MPKVHFVGLVAPNLEHLRPLGGGPDRRVSEVLLYNVLTKTPGEQLIPAGCFVKRSERKQKKLKLAIALRRENIQRNNLDAAVSDIGL